MPYIHIVNFLMSRFVISFPILNGPLHEKTCVQGFVNKKGANQPAHPRSLISAFVIRLLVSSMSKLATSDILIF